MLRTAISHGQEISVCKGTLPRAIVRIIYVRRNASGWWRPSQAPQA